MDKDTIYKLVTTDVRRCGTASRVCFSVIFAKRNSAKLNETEKAVMQMMDESEAPTCWRCGCVTGYPDALFDEEERQQFSEYGLDTRFEI
jgi:hypothetical protein